MDRICLNEDRLPNASENERETPNKERHDMIGSLGLGPQIPPLPCAWIFLLGAPIGPLFNHDDLLDQCYLQSDTPLWPLNHPVGFCPDLLSRERYQINEP